ncbi:hypothetical protein [Zophobihabitans entericus]|uniref:Uncharacterized protein n=1 Tax=Zophobihabitans entericus TaxID=1635327 RepID=A0A6G9I8D8_9GAMM|nr:hypothetical protein [Zophobihabitans entericus]QIQ20476.1 hypothetical protein IPMB12_01535 [Zophobihabitans entericus]
MNEMKQMPLSYCYNKSIWYRLVFPVIAAFLLFFATSSFSAIGTASVETIKGSYPNYHAVALDKFAFEVDGNVYSDGLGNASTLNVSLAIPLLNYTASANPAPTFVSGDMYDDDLDEFDSMSLSRLSVRWIVDNNGTITDITSSLNAQSNICNTTFPQGVLKLRVLSDITVTTQYGDPDTQTYTDDGTGLQPHKDYVIKTQGVCYAQPNLQNGTGMFIGASSQWDTQYGFLVQHTGANFPTTGFNKASFNLNLININASSLIWRSNITGSSAISVDISPLTSSSVKVVLNGPSEASPLAYTPSDIVLTASDGTKDVAIYKFKIDQWFIPATQAAISDSSGYFSATKLDNYCSDLSSSYTDPYHKDLTNNPHVSSASENWIDFYGNYTREIGGGLYSEWGSTVNTYYIGSDWWLNGSQQGQYYPLKEIAVPSSCTGPWGCGPGEAGDRYYYVNAEDGGLGIDPQGGSGVSLCGGSVGSNPFCMSTMCVSSRK